MELLSSLVSVSDRQHSCDTDGAYQHTWAPVHAHRSGKTTAGMYWRRDARCSVYTSFKLLKRFDHLMKKSVMRLEAFDNTGIQTNYE